MRKRTGDWRDLLSAYALAFDAKKIMVGYRAVLLSAVVLVGGALLVGVRQWQPPEPVPDDTTIAAEEPPVAEHVDTTVAHSPTVDPAPPGEEPETYIDYLRQEGGKEICLQMGRLLNPFLDFVHFIISMIVYGSLIWIWSGQGGVICRLAALEYAKDDLPTLRDATTSVRSRRMAYFLAPLTPLLGLIALTLACVVGGLIASIPYFGRVVLFLTSPALLVAAFVMLFLIVVGVLAYGMMMPAVSASGKGAFEGWSTAYSYVIWGFGRFVVYTLLLGVIGVVAVEGAMLLVSLLVYLAKAAVDMGFISRIPWCADSLDGLLNGTQSFEEFFALLMATIFALVWVAPVAYAFSYFFSANTILFFLMRKHVDNVDVDVIQADEAPAPAAETPAVAPAPEREIADEDVTSAAEEALEDEQEEGSEEESAAEEGAAEEEDESEPAEDEDAEAEEEDEEEDDKE